VLYSGAPGLAITLWRSAIIAPETPGAVIAIVAFVINDMPLGALGWRDRSTRTTTNFWHAPGTFERRCPALTEDFAICGVNVTSFRSQQYAAR
jgi:hypothetical protein